MTVSTAVLGGGFERPVAARRTLDEEVPPGTMVHQFEVIRELGRGGMGRVFLARDTKLARLVALKFMTIGGAQFADRFVIEARATARCQHDNIVVIYEVDEWEGLPYMALEFLEGQSLSDAVEERPLPWPSVLDIMTRVVRALVRAHASNIVHCDLKPDNVFLTSGGGVKVLDFGIAQISREAAELAHGLSDTFHDGNTISGTPAYMSPEQWSGDGIDDRSDLWAVGIMFWEALAQRHPLGVTSMATITAMLADAETPLPSLATVASELPADAPALPRELIEVVDRCLVKQRQGRVASARALLGELEAMAPGRAVQRRTVGANPYPGLAAFQEADADRFFGREREIDATLARLAEAPLLVLAGASGAGKSSFVRAGVVPALRTNHPHVVATLRPGAQPLANLITAIRSSELEASESEALDVERCEREPGYLATRLRIAAYRRRARVLIYVDQFEELFTLADESERAAFIATLLGIADDSSSPLRVIVSIRSDFLDRMAAHPALLERVSRGLMLLGGLGREGLRAALVQPLTPLGYRFEDDALIDEMVDELAGTSGALPLLQFTAASLWDKRDREDKTLTREVYRELGGVGGALASQGEQLLRALPEAHVRLLRACVLRLVTPEGTRAVVDRSELDELGARADVAAVLDLLAANRLITIDDSGGAAVELVHEALISHWPSLRRWREEVSEETALLHELRPAARQWEARNRPDGLLWSGDALAEARRAEGRLADLLLPVERAFVARALELEQRGRRRKRMALAGAFGVLILLVVAASVGLAVVRSAQTEATEQRDVATREADRARTAEREATRRLDEVRAQQRLREAAEADRSKAEASALATAAAKRVVDRELVDATSKVVEGEQSLAVKNRELAASLKVALAARARADDAVARATAAQAELERRLEAERAEVARLKKDAGKLVSGGGLR